MTFRATCAAQKLHMPSRVPKWRRALAVDPVPVLVRSENPAISEFAKRDLLDAKIDVRSTLWGLPLARKIVAKQQVDGSWRYPGGNLRVRSRKNFDQLETFRQVGVLVEKLGFTREHPAMARAAECLFSFQTSEGDFRGIYGNQYATTYSGAITELLIKAGYADDDRIAKAFRWFSSARQEDGGWAIPARTVGAPLSEIVGARRRRTIAADRSKPSSHLVTGMVLRAYAAHPTWRKSAEGLRAAKLFIASLYRKDAYPDRGAVRYWERVSFPFWFTDVVSALDTLSRMQISADEPRIRTALDRLTRLQRADGTFALELMKNKDPDLKWWICLAVCRALARWR